MVYRIVYITWVFLLMFFPVSEQIIQLIKVVKLPEFVSLAIKAKVSTSGESFNSGEKNV